MPWEATHRFRGTIPSNADRARNPIDPVEESPASVDDRFPLFDYESRCGKGPFDHQAHDSSISSRLRPFVSGSIASTNTKPATLLAAYSQNVLAGPIARLSFNIGNVCATT